MFVSFLSCTLSYFCAVCLSLGCLVESHAVGSLILLYDGHWDDQLLCMSYNAHIMCLDYWLYICILQCQVWLSGQLGTVLLTQQVRGQCFCGWTHHTKIYFVLCRINWIWWKGATILNVDGFFDTIMRAAWFCLLLQPRPDNKHLKLMDAC